MTRKAFRKSGVRSPQIDNQDQKHGGIVGTGGTVSDTSASTESKDTVPVGDINIREITNRNAETLRDTRRSAIREPGKRGANQAADDLGGVGKVGGSRGATDQTR